ncbi:hypothetical protein B0H13DRAFT_2327794 [Mycena leptocephala]|nr:hypothetical protein B0H13DRAFT_2327794 [Mycena leptocephala]
MFPNKSVAALLPADQLQYTPLGNLVVVKHRLPSPDASPVSNADLPLDDIVPADFPYVDEMVRRAPSTPVKPKASSSRPVGPASPSLYRVKTPTQIQYTEDWSQAAHATQGIPHAHVNALSKRPKLRGVAKTYVVFRGRTTGILYSWAETERATTDIDSPFLDCCAPLRPSCSPPDSRERTDLRDRSLPSTPNDPYYVVYAGVNPGVFSTSIECALNVLGIRSSIHESVATYQEARDKFRRAQGRNEVSKCRARVV